MPDAQTHDGPGPDLDLIIGTVVGAFGVSRMNLMSVRRDAKYVQARWVGMWLAREMTPLSYQQIGRGFGNRDHSTVMHAVAAIGSRMSVDPEFARRVRKLRAAIGRGEARKGRAAG